MFIEWLCVCLVAAGVAPWVHRAQPSRSGWILAAPPLAITLYFLALWPRIASGEVIQQTWTCIPELAFHLSFYLDGLSLVFVLLISGIGTGIVLYTQGYLHGHPQQGRFYAFLLLFMASMLGVVLSDNIITLFIFWELTSFSSYLLIGFNHESEKARASALMALFVTGVGGLFLFAGLVLLAQTAGASELSAMRVSDVAFTESPLYVPMLLLILIGAFTKSAQMPFHFWLPRAMEAPTPASAYLHSSTMVKAGIYLLARVHPMLGDTSWWTIILCAVGGITMLGAAAMALRQTILKPLLAYSTVSALGAMTMMLGMGVPYAAKAVIVFLVAHGLYKATLFLVAGALDHETGEKNTDALGGLRRAMPYTACAGVLAALSMIGLPPFLGFIGKESLYGAALGATQWNFSLTMTAVLASMLFMFVAWRAGLKPFVGTHAQTPKHPHDPPWSMRVGPLLLALLGLIFGVFPMLLSPLTAQAASAIYGESLAVKLTLWHGINLPLLLSLVTLAGGVAIVIARDALLHVTRLMLPWSRVGPTAVYDAWLKGIQDIASWQTRLLQNGHLRYYTIVIVSTALGLIGYSLIGRGLPFPIPQSSFDLNLTDMLLFAVLVVAIVAAVVFRSRLASVAALGVVGYGVAMIYVLYGAPDLAMTQIVIETLTLLLLILAFYHLPPFANLSTRSEHARDLLVSLGVGAVMTLLVLTALSNPGYSTISPYFAETAVEKAHGRNIVNVILVDYRALDTLGEITVLALAGLGGYALLKLKPGGRRRR